MFTRSKTYLLLSGLLLLSLVLGACAQATPQPTKQEDTPVPIPSTAEPTTPLKKIKIGLFVPVSGNTYEEARLRGAQETAAKYNAEVVNFSGEYDPLEQINQIQDAIASKTFDVLLIHPIDSNAVVPAVQDALNAGLVVINADSPIGPDPNTLEPYPPGVSAFIGRTGKATGEWLGQAVIKACEGKDPCEVAYLIGIQALTIDQVRYQYLEETIKPYPNIKIVAFQEGLYRQDKSYEVMQNVFQANPGIDVVASSGDQMTLGAEKAAKDAGLVGIAFIGNGASKEGCQALMEGRFFATIADIPYTQGQLLVETAIKVIQGKPFEKSIDLNKVSPPLPPDGPVIDKEDLKTYVCQW
ncbi:MAG: Ribose ABC transport system, periplasmic ribose-binding protein RbsB [Anaerolineae bacterium]|nr:MAG: Ribose ABC transport system, periplasmic ribose-binding protein RbsB [Anaerolineae bacterium]